MLTVISFSILFCFLSPRCNGADSLSLGQSISGSQTITSAGDKFVLGFFSPGTSKNLYVGIWYTFSVGTIVWVANREDPITDSSSGALQFGSDGNLVVSDGRNMSLWSTNSSSLANSKPSAKLLDSGNLVLIDDNTGRRLWQSFDYPSDTILPGMKLGIDLKTSNRWSFVPWKTSDDPAPGPFSLELDRRGGWPQIFIMNGLSRSWRTGPWNGHTFSGIPEMYPETVNNWTFVNNKDEIYFSFSLFNSSIISRLVLDTEGILQRFTWHEGSRRWLSYWKAPALQCENYGACGPFSSCSRTNSSFCSCLQGFEPKNPRDWLLRDWSGGCVRRTQLECGVPDGFHPSLPNQTQKQGDGFLKLIQMELPDSYEAQVDESFSLLECRAKCLANCSCTAYANSDIRGGGSGCVLWAGDLIDLRQLSGGGQDLYLRVASSELTSTSAKIRSKVRRAMIIIATTISAMILLAICIILWWKRREKARGMMETSKELELFELDGDAETTNIHGKGSDSELPVFSFGNVMAATDNFSIINKLGEGGFGLVYKGKLPEGQEIAVKRLSWKSSQGLEEFKNEVSLISKLQHRNLLRVLGCCIHKEEKILIYEYMPNKSLDLFLFDPTKRATLDWEKRFNIIEGIAQGLLYLHQYSRLRIIHRDLKASNILLDGEMNPKISDFGMARIFGGDQTQANTSRVVGTYGYMSPEYALNGWFSIKSDVFSFGVLLLEIISGKKISSFFHFEESLNLIGYAWQLWREGRGLELLDSSLGNSCPTCGILKCIHIGLLCVQEDVGDRPTMSSVILMLASETTSLPTPKKPGFSIGRAPIERGSSSSGQRVDSVNEITITVVEGR